MSEKTKTNAAKAAKEKPLRHLRRTAAQQYAQILHSGMRPPGVAENPVEQFTPNPVTHEHGENGCGKNPRAWEMEMMHQVWAAGLHDAANCFQDALEAKWKLESQKKVKPKTNSDRIRYMTDEELAQFLSAGELIAVCKECWLDWLCSPVEESET